MDIRNVIIKPVITERSMDLVSKGKFTFRVAKSASKPNIKKAVEELFKVKVLDIATSNVKGKKKRFGARRTEIVEPSWKKAVVRLSEGQKIELFGGSSS